jgi:phosphohistidine phosphatase
VAEHLKKNEHNIIWDDDIYEAALSDLIHVIDRHSAGQRRVLIVGHNPGLDNLLCYLSYNEPELTTSGKLLTTSAVAVLEFEGVQIDTTDHAAQLTVLMRPKQLN